MQSGLLISRGLALPALLLLLMLSPAAQSCSFDADDKKAKAADKDCGPRVRVSIVIILASETDKKVHPKLKCIADEVTKMYPKLTGFRLYDVSYKSLPVGIKDVFELVEKQTATVTVQCRADKKDRVRLKIAPPKMGEITYSTPCGKFLPIVTPYRTKKGEQVIIALRVEPCKGKGK